MLNLSSRFPASTLIVAPQDPGHIVNAQKRGAGSFYCLEVKLEAITLQVFGLIGVIPQGSLRACNEFISKGGGENIILLMSTYTSISEKHVWLF